MNKTPPEHRDPAEHPPGLYLISGPLKLTGNPVREGHTFGLPDGGKGRSVFIAMQAGRLDISYEEMVKRLGPNAEQSAASVARELTQQALDDARLAAVRQAFWAHSAGLNDLESLADEIRLSFQIKEPSKPQVKSLFDALPAHILGQIISWGFMDTEVREAISRYVVEQYAELATRMGLSPTD